MAEAMLIQCAPSRFLRWKTSITPNKAKKIISYTPILNLFLPPPTFRVRNDPFSGGVRAQNHGNTTNKVEEIETEAKGQLEKGEDEDFSSGHEVEDDEEGYKAVEEEYSHASAYRARRDEKDYDRDPEIAEILGSCFDDPKKAQSKIPAGNYRGNLTGRTCGCRTGKTACAGNKRRLHGTTGKNGWLLLGKPVAAAVENKNGLLLETEGNMWL